MKKFLVVILLFMHLSVNAQRKNLIFEQAFDTEVGNWYENNMLFPYSATLSDFTKRAGAKSLQVDLKKVDNYRAEFGTDPKKSLPEQWVGLSVYLPSKFIKDVSEEGIVQFQAYPDLNLGEDWRSPPLLLGILNDHYILDTRTDDKPVTIQGNYIFERVDLGLVTKDTWTDFVFHIRWAYNNTGILELWKNGKLVYSRLNKPNSYNDKLYPYFKCGIYKWDWGGQSNSVTTERLLYIDEVRIGNEKATFEDVSPEPVTNPDIAGYINREQWDNVTGTNISDIPIQVTPTLTNKLGSFEGPINIGDNYGSRIRGYISPPQSGNYTFWLATDDAGELWLSTDDNPNNKVRIANINGWTNYREWNKYSSQKSIPITLQAGKKYYVEALEKESSGGDNLSVQWQLPNGLLETPIAGSHLSPYATVVADQTINFAALASKTYGDVSFMLTASASSGLAVSFDIISGPASLSGNTVTITGVGTVVIAASQVGNSSFNAAKIISQSFTVMPAATYLATGTILREQWDNVLGGNISDIPLTTKATSTTQLTSFEGPLNIADNYGSRIRGYICAPQTGSYTFWIAGDDSAELWLSTDDNPNHKVRIANLLSWTNYREWTKFSSQKSTSIHLEAGKKYYVEALQKEGPGGDNLSVQWQLPSGTIESPLPGTYLSPYLSQQITTSSLYTNSLNNLEIAKTDLSSVKVKEGLFVYPNPISQQANVEFTLIDAGQTDINLYDTKGRLINKLFSGTTQANTKVSFVLNVDALNGGVYIMHLTSGKCNLTKKIIVMK